MVLVAVAGTAGCKWFVTERVIRDAKDRDNDSYLAWQVGGEDCDDDDPQVHPKAVELCGDSIDNNCNGLTDDIGIGQITWYIDLDGDGFGDEGTQREACPDALLGTDWAPRAGDCDDARPGVSAGEDEVCGDGLDNDCDGEVDNGPAQMWADRDGDGYGDPEARAPCDGGGTLAPNDLDCDDTDPFVFTDALEICDGVDNDCDGDADEDLVAATVDRSFNTRTVNEALSLATETVEICSGEYEVDPHTFGSLEEVVVSGLGRGETVLVSSVTPFDRVFKVGTGSTLTLKDLSVESASAAVVTDIQSNLTVLGCSISRNTTGSAFKEKEATSSSGRTSAATTWG
ncbi:MAG: putative metal-binding motif-containing protein [Myxococcales bacterium]|nr:putative metal-binding motif-containing protein [Myxococcales bacterium]